MFGIPPIRRIYRNGSSRIWDRGGLNWALGNITGRSKASKRDLEFTLAEVGSWLDEKSGESE